MRSLKHLPAESQVNYQIAITAMPTPSIRLEQLLDGRYQVVRVLAATKFSQSCIAEDITQLGKPQYLVKCFKTVSSDQASLKAARLLFYSEVQKLKHLSEQTRQVPQIWNYFEQDQEFFLIEEIIQGHPLSDELTGGKPKSEIEVIEILVSVLKTLQLAHHQQIIHGDINPQNLIRRDRDGQLVLVNFAAIAVIRTLLLHSSVTPLLGTPSYMPNEQSQGKIHANCDIYALGLTAIQALTGLHPSLLAYNGKTETFSWQTQAHVNSELEVILDQMIKHDSEKRYQYVEDVIADLRPFIEPIAPTQILYPSSRNRSSNWLILCGTGCLALILLGSAWFVFRKDIPDLDLLQPSFLPPSWLKPQGQEVKPLQAFPKLQLKSTLTGHKGWIRSLVFFPNGRSFASGSYDQTTRLWNLDSQAPFVILSNHLGFLSGINAIAINTKNAAIATGNLDKTIRLWDYRSNLASRVLTGHQDQVFSLAFDSNGQSLVSASADHTVRVWDWQKNKLLRTLQGHKDLVLAVAISPDGQAIASGSQDKTIKLWNLNTGAELQTFSGHKSRVRTIAFSPNGKILASGSQDKTIKLWNLETGTEIATLNGHTDTVTSISFNADGRILASGSFDTTVKLWDISTFQEIQTLSGHKEPILALAFSPRSNTLISGGCDRTIKVWQ